MTDDQDELLAKARELRSFPIKRSDLVADLNLEGLESTRSGGCVAMVFNGAVQFLEVWEHPCGLTITGYYSEREEDAVARINNFPRSSKRGSEEAWLRGIPFPGHPEFQVVSVSRGERKIYWSYESQRDGVPPDGDKPAK